MSRSSTSKATTNAEKPLTPVITVSDHVIQIATALFFLTLEIFKGIFKTIASWFSSGKKLNGEVVVITGGAGGLGKRLARRFLENGCRVALVDVSTVALEKVVQDLESLKLGRVNAYVCDVTDRHAVYELFTKVTKDMNSSVSILVNNAGIVSGKKFLDNTDEAIIRTFNVNMLSNYWTVRACLPDMIKKNKGHLVTIASAAGLCGAVGLSDYSASKWAQVGFDESIRMELKQAGSAVKTTCVCPYIIDTGMFDGVTSRFPKILPVLDPEFVSHRILHAVRNDVEMLVLPEFPKVTLLCRAILPVTAFDYLAEFFSINRAMAHFKGK